MPKIVLASSLARWIGATGEPSFALGGDTLAAALNELFVVHPNLRSYVVDEHDTVRHHVAIFIDGVAISDKHDLAIPLAPNTEIYILQALSGG